MAARKIKIDKRLRLRWGKTRCPLLSKYERALRRDQITDTAAVAAIKKVKKEKTGGWDGVPSFNMTKVPFSRLALR